MQSIPKRSARFASKPMFHTIHHGTLEYLTADALCGSVHCFSTRFGGVSEGALSSLNLGTHRGDKPENVRENYRILGAAAGFSPEETVFTRQEHTDLLLRVGEQDCGTGLEREQTAVCDGILTDEPGVYETDLVGIRIENELECVDAGTNQYGHWLKFEPLTLVPISTEPVIVDELTRDQINWLNDYHAHVYEMLSPRLHEDEKVWLKEKCAPIGR